MLYACEYYKLQQAHFHFQDLNVHLTWNMALNFSAIILIKVQLYLRVYMVYMQFFAMQDRLSAT